MAAPAGPTAALTPKMAGGLKPRAKLATVEAQATALAPLEAGKPVYSDRQFLFESVPKEFGGFQFTQSKALAGLLQFRVLTDGLVYMACNFNAGGSGGPWQKEALSDDQLRRKGWHREREAVIKIADEVWIIFSRECKKNEEFSIRTAKYATPMLLVK
jgi:hypothetical protein